MNLSAQTAQYCCMTSLVIFNSIFISGTNTLAGVHAK